MTYKTFIIDMFNLAYREQTKISSPTDIANNVINFINDEVKQRLEEDGIIYLTFDPLPKSDLGMEKNFKYSTTRQEIKSEYKSNRVHNPNVLAAVKLLRKYYTYRGSSIKIVISNDFEADDFVEGLVAKHPDGMVALVSTDMDWARYINDRTHMINSSFNTPFTKDDFFNKNGYFPTVTAITLYKAIFGDESDNISPIMTKKNKIHKDSTDFIKALIKEISKLDISLSDAELIIEGSSRINVLSKENRDFIEEIVSLISVSEDAMEEFKLNLRLIKSRCNNVDKCIHSHPENKSYNSLMESTLGRKKSSEQKFTFGNIKLKK